VALPTVCQRRKALALFRKTSPLKGCTVPQIVPLAAALGVAPPQRSSAELQHLGCALAVFVPFAPAATLLGWACGVSVSLRAVWEWVQAAGQRAMAQLHAQLQAVAAGDLPTAEPLAAELAALPLALGADGVMVPLRPAGGQSGRLGPLGPPSHPDRRGGRPAVSPPGGGRLGGDRGPPATSGTCRVAPGPPGRAPGGLAQ